MSTRRFWIRLGVAVVAGGAVGVHHATTGLDRADKLGSVIGAVVAVVALVLTLGEMTRPGGGPRGHFLRVRRARVGGSVVQETRGPASVRMDVTSSVVGGDVVQRVVGE